MAAHNNEVLIELPNYISIVQKSLPNVSFMVNPDHVNMTEIRPGFLQHVTILTGWTVFIPTNKMPTEPSLAPPGASPKTSPSYLLLLMCSADQLQAYTKDHHCEAQWCPLCPAGLFPVTDWQVLRESAASGLGGGVLEEYSHSSPSALRTSPPPGLFPGSPNLETLAECKDLLSAEIKGCCVQGRRRFGTQDRAHCWGAVGQSSIHPEDPGTLFLSQFKNCVTCIHCITDYTEDAITFEVHAAHLEWKGSHIHLLFTRCTRPFGHWTSTSVFHTLIFGQHNWADAAATSTMLLRILM